MRGTISVGMGNWIIWFIHTAWEEPWASTKVVQEWKESDFNVNSGFKLDRAGRPTRASVLGTISRALEIERGKHYITFRTTVTRKFCNFKVQCSKMLSVSFHFRNPMHAHTPWIWHNPASYQYRSSRSKLENLSNLLPIPVCRKTSERDLIGSTWYLVQDLQWGNTYCQYYCNIRSTTNHSKPLHILMLPQPNTRHPSQPAIHSQSALLVHT